MNIRNIIISLANIALLSLFIACGDDSVVVENANDTSNPSVTGGATNIGFTKATIEAYFNEDLLTQQYTAPEYGIEYSTSPEFPSGDTHKKTADDIVGRKYTIMLTALMPSTTYYYRSYVSLPGSNRYLGYTQKFNTKELSNIVTSVKVDSVKSTQVTLMGKINQALYSEIASEGKQYLSEMVGVIYSVDKENVQESIKNKLYRAWNTSKLEVQDDNIVWEITGLTPETTYYYAVYTRLGGDIIYSTIDEFKTDARYGKYTGRGISQSLIGSYVHGQWSYVNHPHENQIIDMIVQLQCAQTATLTMPSYTDGAVTVQQITIYNLAMTAAADQSYTSLSIGENCTIDGSIQYNGVTYTAANLYIKKAQATSGSISLKMTLYFQAPNTDDYQMAINFTYEGQEV